MPLPRLAGTALRPSATRPPARLVRIALCEDQEVFRLGLRVVLEAQPDMAVIDETMHLRAALDGVEEVDPEVLVVRQGLVGGESLPVLRDLCRRRTAVLVLAESGEQAEAELVEVLQAGVKGYLPRRSGAQRLVEAVRALARHEVALDPGATRELVRYLTGPAGRAASPRGALDLLTDRQREVAQLVSQGLSNDEIATRLFLSLATVKSHLTMSMRRLGVRTRTQLAILVAREPSSVA
ncbi:response regulator transcription factor [Petropleomorpha daqingensis]|uniref:DNA-binding NarL/FixJ family response regulator n=1 Tax=Petropleomorpha daqingensis TaxID=2026353 RepID=A0A853CEX1_9ACTN|nr:DNA-binding NarL/FixJ family response regulator [Petropleomorpha daqingensis]